jgi:hypothetical protein
VLVSFDEGKTWQPATVRAAAAGRYVAIFTAPATARYVALRTSAADTAGDSVQETLPRAYQITR